MDMKQHPLVERLLRFDRTELAAETYPYNLDAKVRPLIREAATVIEQQHTALSAIAEDERVPPWVRLVAQTLLMGHGSK
jgi:hypothetical protein